MKHITRHTRHISGLLVAISLISLAVKPSYSSDSCCSKIRETSARSNDRLYNKIAIDLVNGKSQQIPVDRMVRLLKKYEVVKFTASDIEPVRNLILREVAFRMIREHYLPKAGDKIRVYKNNEKFAKEAGLHRQNCMINQPAIMLALGDAVLTGEKRIDTLYWQDVAVQISSAIERLWIERISASGSIASERCHNPALFETLNLLKSRYSQEGSVSEGNLVTSSDAKKIINAIDSVFRGWRSDGAICDKDIPLLTPLIKQYMVLNSSLDSSVIAKQITRFKDPIELQSALIERIYVITQNLKINKTSDYAIFAMLQSLLKEISDQISALSKRSPSNCYRFSVKPDKPRLST